MCISRVPMRSASGVGLLSSVKRTPRGAGDFDVIAFAVLVEQPRELRGGEQQQLGERFERAAMPSRARPDRATQRMAFSAAS